VRNCVPASWKTTDLNSVAVITSGQSPPGSTYNISGKGLPFFQGKAEFGETSPTPVKWCSEPLRIAYPGDVLMSVRAPVGPTNLADTTCCIGRGLAAITPLGDMPSKFYLYYLRFSVEALVRQATGTTFQAISGKQLRAHEVLVPPLSEQHRIVEAIESYLSRLDDAVASLERVQQNLKRYRTSVLKAAVEGRLVPIEAELSKKEGRSYEAASELLERILVERRKKWIENAAEKARAKAEKKAREAGKPWTHADNIKTLEKERAKAAKKYKEPAVPDTTDLPDLPEGWCWTTIQHFAEHRLGKMLDKAKNDGKFSKYLRNANVQWFNFDMSDIAQMRITDDEFANVSVVAGDLVVCEGGEPGRCSVWEGQEPIAIQKALHRVRVHPEVQPWFLAYHLGADTLSHRLDQEFTGTTIKHFTGEAFHAHAFAVPPANEQLRIVNAVRSGLSLVNHISTQVQNATAGSSHLRQSILKWAFEGKLVEQDPNDEPASVLLERIKAECSASRRYQ